MKMQIAWIDRNQLLEAAGDYSNPELVSVMAASRTGSIVVQASLVSFWVVVRGSADLDAREGRFHLQAGEWVVLEPDSRPSVYASRDSLVLGVTMPQAMRARIRQSTHLDLHTGRGKLDKGECASACSCGGRPVCSAGAVASSPATTSIHWCRCYAISATCSTTSAE